MSLEPFAICFPNLKETRVIIFQDENHPMKGRYAFEELYCNDGSCDCRRVILHVVDESDPSRVLASINYGWESPNYYAKWMGSKEDSRGMAGASLDPMLPQSIHSQFFLKLFNDVVSRDPAYNERLQRHYAMFKAASPPRSPSRETPNRSWRKQRAKLEGSRRRKRPR
jgi:hypothetical protein